MNLPLSPDNLRRISLLRITTLVAAIGMSALAAPVFRVQPQQQMLAAICAFWAVCAGVLWHRMRASEDEVFWHLAGDIALLTAWLIFCGGVANPLTALYLLPVAAAAALLRAGRAWMLATFSVAAYAALWFIAVPLTVEDTEQAARMHVAGMGLTFILSAVLIVGLVGRMGVALRMRERQLAAARERSLRDQHIVALGSMAAGAAHALGTPLGTLALLADDIADQAANATLHEDAAELRIQVMRCREILTGLLTEADTARAENADATLGTWLERILHRFRQRRAECTPRLVIDAATASRRIRPDAALAQSIDDLLDNAADARPDGIELGARSEGRQLVITVRDRGPGFSATALVKAGREPYSAKDHGMGLGLYLARANAERAGGALMLRNDASGAEVRLQIPLAGVEASP
ncbi:MAG: HAMP domain-containing histidine kinase [Proteobacteria bacterium]|nr:HAMP domain-containing histidine kinase [Pseudomonadota bacterium]HQR04877.1 ATP-binding protein [Rhodocyclaceae bacterium]